MAYRKTLPSNRDSRQPWTHPYEGALPLDLVELPQVQHGGDLLTIDTYRRGKSATGVGVL
jgi:hypothetical protein